MKKYLSQRRSELNEKVNPKCSHVFNLNYDFVEVVIMDKFDEVTPKVTRKIEILEALLFAFIEHGLNLDMLDDIDEHIQRVATHGFSEKAVQ